MENAEELKEKVKDALKDMNGSVKMILFTSEEDCKYCKDALEISELVAESNEKLSLEKYDLKKDEGKSKEYQVDKVPALIIHGEEKRMVRFYGLPAGYEFSTLISDIKDASNTKPDISADLIEKIKKIDKELHIQVLVTPTCPHCPQAVKVAHDMALLNPKIKADMIEASEFPDIIKKYNVTGVPKTVINETTEFTGAQPLDIVLKKIEEMK
jgi:glutaredoxin-like protein